jgi:hypothetical protein
MSEPWGPAKSRRLLIGSTLCTLLLGLSIVLAKKGIERGRNEKYKITAIVQTGPVKEALKTTYLAELLGLSAAAPEPLYGFNLKKGEAKLRACPLIKEARLKRVPPSSLLVDYEVRRPIAYVGDYENTAIDEEGSLFPVAPFLTPKRLPEIYLGLPEFVTWRLPLNHPRLSLAFELLHLFEESAWKENFRILRIDVSNAFAETLGRREIVLMTEEELLVGSKVCVFPKLLRLPVKGYQKQLANFQGLRESLIESYQKQLKPEYLKHQVTKFESRIIDLRIAKLAFIENKGER